MGGDGGEGWGRSHSSGETHGARLRGEGDRTRGLPALFAAVIFCFSVWVGGQADDKVVFNPPNLADRGEESRRERAPALPPPDIIPCRGTTASRPLSAPRAHFRRRSHTCWGCAPLAPQGNAGDKDADAEAKRKKQDELLGDDDAEARGGGAVLLPLCCALRRGEDVCLCKSS